jgi:U32 family peptidase
MESKHPGLPELLAPAGNIESFFAAVENGADAVYLGLKQLSARASAHNFSLEELASLLPFAHQRQKAIYVALNSLVTAPEYPQILNLLQALSDLRVDALIVQDPGIFYLVRHHFPRLKLHASTLMAVHNSAGVNQLERCGAQRVVLARELTLAEIRQIAATTRAELEIFVHGALCFSYSGLCLASSFRGGHSGLQGRCVQPCRLRFQQGRKEGYSLSCNDFCALPFLPKLKELRLSAVKIEGRMKPADYVALVVKAYRRVLDAPAGEEADVVEEAREWLLQAPARRLTGGFLGDTPGEEVLSPHRSGSSGLWVGTIKAVEGTSVTVAPRHAINSGDRLRVESTDGKEKAAFTVTDLRSLKGKVLSTAEPGIQVKLRLDVQVARGERLFRVAAKTVAASKSPAALWRQVRAEVPRGLPFTARFSQTESVQEQWPVPPTRSQRATETLFVKIGRAQDLAQALLSPADWVLLTATKANLERLSRQKLIPAHKKRFVWSLPPILLEKDLDYYRPAVLWFLERGFSSWEVNNWGHLELFPEREHFSLIAGYRFNLRNAAALAIVAEAGCRWAVLSVEITRTELEILPRSPLGALPIVSIYSWPPLFTSRLAVKLQPDRPLLTPRKDIYWVQQEKNQTRIYAERPVNWFARLPQLRAYGHRHFLIDLSDGPQDQMKVFDRILSGFKHNRADEPYSLFNLDREPVK